MDPYVTKTGVLRNKLLITDPAELAQAEADITAVKIARLAEGHRIPGKYDLRHLQNFHKFIFGDIYRWAGEIRTVNIAKGQQFAQVGAIPGFANSVFGDLRERKFLQGMGQQEFVRELAKAYGDLNALHPFREGNGRTQRAFLAQLARDAGYRLDWSRMDPKANVDASVRELSGKATSEEAFGELLGPLVSPLKTGRRTGAGGEVNAAEEGDSAVRTAGAKPSVPKLNQAAGTPHPGAVPGSKQGGEEGPGHHRRGPTDRPGDSSGPRRP
ncbi:Fic/DOC family protein [Marinitenerispora sediminis]|uniref:Fic/DOC family protein n=1 Tax=Marinitenerispora sediminis TaxID=1931232 RepID=UPI001314B722|nr:Fic family protein [Marinitenerispora sediminis]